MSWRDGAGKCQPSEQTLALMDKKNAEARNAVIEECVIIALGGAKQCCEGDSEWHRAFRYAASNTALLIADRIRALKHSSVSRPERESL